MDRALIERFAQGGATLRAAASGWSHEDERKRPGPGKWSALELVIHLADMDAVAIDRMKRILTQDNPTLLGADEDAYVAKLHPHEQVMEDAVTLFEVNRRQFARTLRQLDDVEFERLGTHNVAGPMTLAQILQTYSDHLDHHLKFLEAKRQRIAEARG